MLARIARYCRANRTTYTGNRDELLIFEGRRQVWLLINQYINLTPGQIDAIVQAQADEEAEA